MATSHGHKPLQLVDGQATSSVRSEDCSGFKRFEFQAFLTMLAESLFRERHEIWPLVHPAMILHVCEVLPHLML